MWWSIITILLVISMNVADPDPNIWDTPLKRDSYRGYSGTGPADNVRSTSRSSSTSYSSATVTDGNGNTRGIRSGSKRASSSFKDPRGQYSTFSNSEEFVQPTKFRGRY